jgi:hypothetical protein
MGLADQHILEDGEHVVGSRYCQRHAAQFPQQLIPALAGCAVQPREGGEQLMESRLAMLGKQDGPSCGVNVPAKDAFSGTPFQVPFVKFGEGYGVLVSIGIGGGRRTEDLVHSGEQGAFNTGGCWCLSQPNKVIHIHIHIGQWCGRGLWVIGWAKGRGRYRRPLRVGVWHKVV